jgi:hypothetical protein
LLRMTCMVPCTVCWTRNSETERTDSSPLQTTVGLAPFSLTFESSQRIVQTRDLKLSASCSTRQCKAQVFYLEGWWFPDTQEEGVKVLWWSSPGQRATVVPKSKYSPIEDLDVRQ